MTTTFTTKAGTKIPLLNLKGKPYMQVPHRIQWFTEEVPFFDIKTDFILLTDEQTVVKARILILDENGKVTRSAEATKRETKKDFSDHTEKAETAAIGRALAQLGYGTQFALTEMDEGPRLVDSPVNPVKKVTSDYGPEYPDYIGAVPFEEPFLFSDKLDAHDHTSSELKTSANFAFAPILHPDSSSIFDKVNEKLLSRIKTWNREEGDGARFHWYKNVGNYVLFANKEPNLGIELDKVTVQEFSELTGSPVSSFSRN